MFQLHNTLWLFKESSYFPPKIKRFKFVNLSYSLNFLNRELSDFKEDIFIEPFRDEYEERMRWIKVDLYHFWSWSFFLRGFIGFDLYVESRSIACRIANCFLNFFPNLLRFRASFRTFSKPRNARFPSNLNRLYICWLWLNPFYFLIFFLFRFYSAWLRFSNSFFFCEHLLAHDLRCFYHCLSSRIYLFYFINSLEFRLARIF